MTLCVTRTKTFWSTAAQACKTLSQLNTRLRSHGKICLRVRGMKEARGNWRVKERRRSVSTLKPRLSLLLNTTEDPEVDKRCQGQDSRCTVVMVSPLAPGRKGACFVCQPPPLSDRGLRSCLTSQRGPAVPQHGAFLKKDLLLASRTEVVTLSPCHLLTPNTVTQLYHKEGKCWFEELSA